MILFHNDSLTVQNAPATDFTNSRKSKSIVNY